MSTYFSLAGSVRGGVSKNDESLMASFEVLADLSFS